MSKNPKKRKRAQTPGPTPTPVELPTNRNANRAQSQPPASEPSKKRKILESMIESGGITPINPPPIMTKRKRNSGGPQPQSAGPKLHVEDEGNKEEKEQSVPEPKKILKRKATKSNLKEKVVTFEPIASTSSLPPPTHEELHKKKEAGKGEADQEKVTESGKVKKTSGSKGKGKEDAVESVNVPGKLSCPSVQCLMLTAHFNSRRRSTVICAEEDEEETANSASLCRGYVSRTPTAISDDKERCPNIAHTLKGNLEHTN